MNPIHSDSMKIYDISPEISEKSAVFPGDRLFKRKVLFDMNRGDPITLSSIETTLHMGAHADAPNHYSLKGKSIAARDLKFYLGLCQVVSASKPSHAKGRIFLEDLSTQEIQAPRVLFKTNSFANPNRWQNDFFSLSEHLIQFLAEKGVILVGIDTPSVDPWDDKFLASHKTVWEHDMAILEGLVLQAVPDGLYSLIALPLKIKDADASPVRAVLIDSTEKLRGKFSSERD